MSKIWETVLEDCCNCYADPDTGNRPCDEGAICSRCSADWVKDEFRRRLANNEANK